MVSAQYLGEGELAYKGRFHGVAKQFVRPGRILRLIAKIKNRSFTLAVGQRGTYAVCRQMPVL